MKLCNRNKYREGIKNRKVKCNLKLSFGKVYEIMLRGWDK